MKKRGQGRFQQRFDALWAIMAKVDVKNAGEISPWLVSRIIGCSERRARGLISVKMNYIRGNRYEC